jgi:hypothetical protein
MMYQQFLLDEWRRRNMRQKSKDFFEQGESSGEYDEESGTGSEGGEEFEYDDEDESDIE